MRDTRVETIIIIIIEVDGETDRLCAMVVGGVVGVQKVGQKPQSFDWQMSRTGSRASSFVSSCYPSTLPVHCTEVHQLRKNPGLCLFVSCTLQVSGVLLSASNPKGCSSFTVLQDTFSNACHS